METDAWLTIAVALSVVTLLATDRFSPALVMGGGVTVLLLGGVIDNSQALSGFGSDAPITIAALYILAYGVEVTGAFDRLSDVAFGSRQASDEGSGLAHRKQLSRITIPAAGISGMLPNTPLVGMLAPRIVAWCRRTGRSPSRYLMPLSYAVIFGGCITLIGTSTNLIVSDLLTDIGSDPLSVFEITPVGLPMAVIGILLIVLLAPKLLPHRETPSEDLGENLREFTIELLVLPGSDLAGSTIQQAGLRNLEGVFLIEVERHGQTLPFVSPSLELRDDDRLVFAGNIGRVLDLERIPGLVNAQERHFSDVRGERSFFEAVVGEGSPLIGSTLKQTGFRTRYSAAVLAIHRSGARVPGKLGDVKLQAGDVLLVVAGPEFESGWRGSNDFLLVAALGETKPVRHERKLTVQLIALGFIVLAATGVLDLLQASLLAAVALVGTRCVTTTEARQAINLDVILLMATSFGLGIALDVTGVATDISRFLVNITEPFGDVGTLAGILIATMLVTELLSNNAAAVLMFPIATATAAQTGMLVRPLAFAILFGATLSFLTPIGYQTNTMVWGLGGYRYRDFSRLGAPLTLITMITLIVAIPIVFPLR